MVCCCCGGGRGRPFLEAVTGGVERGGRGEFAVEYPGVACDREEIMERCVVEGEVSLGLGGVGEEVVEDVDLGRDGVVCVGLSRLCSCWETACERAGEERACKMGDGIEVLWSEFLFDEVEWLDVVFRVLGLPFGCTISFPEIVWAWKK